MQHRRLKLVGGVVVALLVVATPISADDTFRLGNVCEPVNLLVEELPHGAAEIGLTRGDIATTVRSKLRAARLYGTSRIIPVLYVNVNVQGIAFSVRLEFRKMLFDPISEMANAATTWNKSMTGQSGSNADYILSTASLLTDMFIDEYLRVNEPACPRSPIDP